jgi:hypothetical protein
VDEGSDEQLNKAPAMNGNESVGKRMAAPPLHLDLWPPNHPNYIKFYSRTHVKNVKGGASRFPPRAQQRPKAIQGDRV